MGRDTRGKQRGRCTTCDCEYYATPEKGDMCEYCGHFAPSHAVLGKCNSCDKCDQFNEQGSPTKCSCKCFSQCHEVSIRKLQKQNSKGKNINRYTIHEGNLLFEKNTRRHSIIASIQSPFGFMNRNKVNGNTGLPIRPTPTVRFASTTSSPSSPPKNVPPIVVPSSSGALIPSPRRNRAFSNPAAPITITIPGTLPSPRRRSNSPPTVPTSGSLPLIPSPRRRALSYSGPAPIIVNPSATLSLPSDKSMALVVAGSRPRSASTSACCAFSGCSSPGTYRPPNQNYDFCSRSHANAHAILQSIGMHGLIIAQPRAFAQMSRESIKIA